jgi:hypothetical protein
VSNLTLALNKAEKILYLFSEKRLTAKKKIVQAII